MTHDARAAVDVVRELAPAISSRSAEIESARRLPPDLLAQLIQAGCFRWSKRLGGLEINFPSSTGLIELLARADGGFQAGRPWRKQPEWIRVARPVKVYRPR